MRILQTAPLTLAALAAPTAALAASPDNEFWLGCAAGGFAVAVLAWIGWLVAGRRPARDYDWEDGRVG